MRRMDEMHENPLVNIQIDCMYAKKSSIHNLIKNSKKESHMGF